MHSKQNYHSTSAITELALLLTHFKAHNLLRIKCLIFLLLFLIHISDSCLLLLSYIKLTFQVRDWGLLISLRATKKMWGHFRQNIIPTSQNRSTPVIWCRSWSRRPYLNIRAVKRCSKCDERVKRLHCGRCHWRWSVPLPRLYLGLGT